MSRYTHPYDDLRERVDADLTKHEMTVLHHDGLYRHVRFKEPGTSMYYFDLVTWPGALAFKGDMGSWVFSRVEDMFEFFDRSTYINPGYWGQKVVAGEVREFSQELLRERVLEEVGYLDLPPDTREELLASIEDEVFNVASDVGSAHAALLDFRHEVVEFPDSWDWELKDFIYQFLWACRAIQWGIARVRAMERADVA